MNSARPDIWFKNRARSGRPFDGGGRSVLVLGALLALAWGCAGPGGAAPPKASSPIRVGPVSRRDFSQVVPWLGRVESERSVTVVALEAGRVEATLVDDGARVRKGTPLFRLGGPDLSPSLSAARAAVSGLQARMDLAEKVARLKEEAVRDRIADESALAAARSDVERLKADLVQARSRLAPLEALSVVRSPVSGIFTGRAVNPGQDVFAGAVLAQVVSPSDLRVAATLFPPAGARLLNCPASVDAGGESIQTRVSRVFPERTEAGGVKVWIEGPDLAPSLGPGSAVSGSVTLKRVSDGLAVPESAVVFDDQEQAYVFVERSGSYSKTPVSLGLASPGWVEVTKGLEGGDRVVVEGAYELYYRDFGRTYRVED